ncbi:MAG TPA: hypothetical protein DCK95_01905 [Anaerolineaceae bacterium]|nr:hypothetical protein [Anaerolineaceae bacterium]
MCNFVAKYNSHPVDCTYGNLIYSDSKGKVVRTWQSKPFEHSLFAKSRTPAHPTFYCKREREAPFLFPQRGKGQDASYMGLGRWQPGNPVGGYKPRQWLKCEELMTIDPLYLEMNKN